MDYSAIPADLKALPQWVAWRYENRDGKPTKVPINPRTGGKADATDPATWADFDTAAAHAATRDGHGIGFVFSDADPYCGVDIDHCRDPETGRLDGDAAAIVAGLDSYAERSPSGTGVHVIVKGKPPRNRKGEKVEMYDRDRFFTVTGDRLPGAPATVNDRQLALDGLYYRAFGADSREDAGRPADLPAPTGLPDDLVIAKLMTDKNAARNARLWAGDVSEYDGDDSRARAALIRRVGFYAGGDVEQVERIVRRSGLDKSRWDSKRGRESFIAYEIRRCLSGQTETYAPRPDEVSQVSLSLSMSGTVGTPAQGLQAASFHGTGRPEPVPWIISNLLPERFPTILYGEGGNAKSILAMHIGMTVAAGAQDWMGFKVSQVSRATKGQGHLGHFTERERGCPAVVYLDFELDADVQRGRAYDLAAGMGLDEPPEGFLYMSATGYTAAEAFRAALDGCLKHGAKLLILDSVTHALDGDVEALRDVRGFFKRYLEPFKAAGVSILVVDHQAKMVKGERYSDKTPFGSAFKGWAGRSIIQVKGDWSGSELTATLRQTKTNFGPKQDPFSVRLRFAEGRIDVEYVGVTVVETETQTTRDVVLNALRDGPMYPAGIEERTGLPLKTVKNNLTALRGAGLVENTGNTRRGSHEVRLTDAGSAALPPDNVHALRRGLEDAA
jgi:hypothetical protein